MSVTIVLHNSDDHLADCLASVRRDLADGFAELIAVDNASQDRSAEIVEREAPDATLLHSEENLGFAGGANLAWQHVHGRYWMLLNPDAVLSRSALRVMARWLDDHPRIGVASAALRSGDGSIVSAGLALPSPWRTLLEASRLHHVLPPSLHGRILRGQYWTGGDQTGAGWVPGTAMMVRREAVDDVGLLDTRFFLYGEDLEWCLRMRSAGWSIGVCAAATATHHIASSSSKTFASDEVQRRISKGGFEAIRAARGTWYARLCAWTFEAQQTVEAHHPRRTLEERETARQLVRASRAARQGSRALND